MNKRNEFHYSTQPTTTVQSCFLALVCDQLKIQDSVPCSELDRRLLRGPHCFICLSSQYFVGSLQYNWRDYYWDKSSFFNEPKLHFIFTVLLSKLKRDFGSVLNGASNYGGFICLGKRH